MSFRLAEGRTTLECRIPWASNTNGHFCNSAGTVNIEKIAGATSITEFRVPANPARRTTPRCISLQVDGVSMTGTFLAESLYRYVSGDSQSGINIIEGAAYFWRAGGGAGIPGVLHACASPTECTYEFDVPRNVTCTNPAFYAKPYKVDAYDSGGAIRYREYAVWSLILT